VPLDGIVVDGTSSVNLVHLTGENLPVTKKTGDTVPAGARNQEGALTVKVTHTSNDSTLAKIIQLVTQAQEARPALQRWFDSLSKSYAITIILLAFFFAISLPLLLDIPFLGREGSVYRGLAFLIAASPCALIIAIPIAYLSAVSSCAWKGILLKGGIVLDALASCKAIAFDKTGTLTTGNLAFLGIEPIHQKNGSIQSEEAFHIAASMERNAVHPIAKAILAHAGAKTPFIPLTDFKSVPGYGLEASAKTSQGSRYVYIGNPEFIFPKVSEEAASKLRQKIDAVQKQGELVAVMLIDESVYLLRFSDTLRPEIRKTVEALQNKQGLEVVMLTGDHQDTARRVAEEVGIKEFHANLRPEDKLNQISRLALEKNLAMVGDGVNDAPALARATVGICMGKVGSTAALDASDAVLLQDNIELLNWLFDKAHKTQKIVKQNLSIATLAILFAAFPALAGIVPLWLAVIMHEGGTIIVGLNALRLLK
jgi:heavy metal translocating P-type ATPase